MASLNWKFAALRKFEAQMKINLANEIFKAVNYKVGTGLLKTLTHTSEIVNEFVDISVQKNVARQPVNDRLAKEMQAAVLTAYQQNVIALQRVPSYRLGENRLPKALGEALADPEFAQGTGVGINFINTRLLDDRAAHWARLNYGAGGNPDGRPAPTAVVTYGEVSFPLRLNGETRPGFSIPAGGRFGYFNRQGQFYPGLPDREGRRAGAEVLKKKPTKGIGARRFLDAGLEALAVGFQPAYNDYLNRAARSAASNAKNKKFSQ